MALETPSSDFRTHYSLWYILSLILQVFSGCLLPTCSRIYWGIRQHLPTRNLQQIVIATPCKSLCQRWWEVGGWGSGGPGQHSTFCTAPFTQELNWLILVSTSGLSKPAFRVKICTCTYMVKTKQMLSILNTKVKMGSFLEGYWRKVPQVGTVRDLVGNDLFLKVIGVYTDTHYSLHHVCVFNIHNKCGFRKI